MSELLIQAFFLSLVFVFVYFLFRQQHLIGEPPAEKVLDAIRRARAVSIDSKALQVICDKLDFLVKCPLCIPAWLILFSGPFLVYYETWTLQ